MSRLELNRKAVALLRVQTALPVPKHELVAACRNAITVNAIDSPHVARDTVPLPALPEKLADIVVINEGQEEVLVVADKRRWGLLNDPGIGYRDSDVDPLVRCTRACCSSRDERHKNKLPPPSNRHVGN